MGAHRRGEELGDAQAAQVLLVLGERRRDHGRTGRGGELDGETADAAGGADDQDGVPFGEIERVDGRNGGDAGQRRGTGRRKVHAGGGGPIERPLATVISSAHAPSRTVGLACRTKP